MEHLNWERLLCAQRLRVGAEAPITLCTRTETPPRTPAEADVQRVIFSAPFRRLAGKTQVHPFAHVDYVHNRLTHSLEVAEIGAGLTRAVMQRLPLTEEQQAAAALHVRAACLGHDIGNPPYGHMGEAAIRQWMREHHEALAALLALDDEPEPEILEDLEKFDGNAQAFRLLANPLPRESAYFGLTCATLGALIKYPCRACDVPEAKFSCFRVDEHYFATVMQALGLQEARHRYRRHPLSYLTEIADDLCYCVMDCEDAVTLGILDDAQVREWFLKLFVAGSAPKRAASFSIPHLRARLIGHLMEAFTNELEAAFCELSRLDTFEQTSPTWQRLKSLKHAYRIVFDDEAKLRKERQAQEDIRQSLDCLLEAIGVLRYSEIRDVDAMRLLEKTFGKTFVQRHRHETMGWWLHSMLDFVTGMTDAYLHRFAARL